MRKPSTLVTATQGQIRQRRHEMMIGRLGRQQDKVAARAATHQRNRITIGFARASRPTPILPRSAYIFDDDGPLDASFFLSRSPDDIRGAARSGRRHNVISSLKGAASIGSQPPLPKRPMSVVPRLASAAGPFGLSSFPGHVTDSSFLRRKKPAAAEPKRASPREEIESNFSLPAIRYVIELTRPAVNFHANAAPVSGR